MAQLVKNTPVMLGRSPGEGKGYPFQYSGLENSMAVKSMGSQSWTRLSGFNSNTLATSCEELTHWKRPWCWEGLQAGGEGDDRGWDGWMASPAPCTWVWVNSGSWWRTGRPGVLRFMGSQRVGNNWVTELNWSSFHFYFKYFAYLILVLTTFLLTSPFP